MITFVITARTSFTKMLPIIKEAINHKLEVNCIATASSINEKYGDISRSLDSISGLNVKKLVTVCESDLPISMVNTLTLTTQTCAHVFKEDNPSCVVVMADRHEVLGPAIAASYQNIPLVHIQGGELSGNIDNKVRYAISSLADLHFPATKQSCLNLINMGIAKEQIIYSGCPSIDLAIDAIKNENKSKTQQIINNEGVGALINLKEPYIIVMQHPVTNELDQAGDQIKKTLFAINKYGLKTIWFWPNSDAGTDFISKELRRARENEMTSNIRFIKNLPPNLFLPLLNNSSGILGNSSVAIRECSFLGVPAINIGTRQINRERGINVVDCDYDEDQILGHLKNHFEKNIKKDELYGFGKASEIIVNNLINFYEK